MIVSRSRKFIFAHVPKTGGISIRAALEPFADGQADAHADTTHETLPAFLARHPETRDHFKFAFVRNPWDRLVSFYFYAREKLARSIPQMQAVDGLGGMLRELDSDAPWICDLHVMRPQRDFLSGADFTGRFERLRGDFVFACARVGISAELPHKNPSRHGHYAQYYSEWGQDFVAARYRGDIQQFDYSFEAAS